MTDLCDPSKRKILRAKVKAVMDYAIRDKIEKYIMHLNKILAIFADIGFSFNAKAFTWQDDRGNQYDMHDLASPQFLKKFTIISPDARRHLFNAANHIQQDRQAILEYQQRTGGIDDVMKRLETACNRRTEFIDAHGNLMAELNGKYQSNVDPNAIYYISTDPYDIFTKSTGRSWSPANCERIDGESSQGIDSDIAHNSAVVFILDKRIRGFKSAIARMNLRLCVVNAKSRAKKKKYSIGWDINWYRGNHSHDRFTVESTRKFDNLDLSAKQARDELVQIIRNHGFNTNYKICITPFAHEGYSDIEAANRTAIAYQAIWPYHCDVCGVPTKKEFFERYGGKCHFCGTHSEH